MSYVTITFNVSTLLWHTGTTGRLIMPPYEWADVGGPYSCISRMIPLNFSEAGLHEDMHGAWYPPGGAFWQVTSGPYTGKLVYAYTNARGYGDITIGSAGSGTGTPGTPGSDTPTIDPLADWRILIKGMGGTSTMATTNQLTFNEQTLLWHTGTTGTVIYPPYEYTTGSYPQGPYDVEPVVLHLNYNIELADDGHNAWYPNGGSFWKLTSGPYAGKLVYFWTNERGYGDFSVVKADTLVAGAGNRGPGATLCTIYRPEAHLAGASLNYNAPGELHFTLLVDDPNILVPKPKLTHYAVEFYDVPTATWVETFAGLIWDVDATDTEAVFYGIDYLALLNYVVDERFNPVAAGTGAENEPVGSKYNYKSVKYILEHVIRYAIDKANSPVGFLVWGSAPAEMDVARTVSTFYSTFRPVLDMCVGLINSHRAGTGIMSRIQVVKVLDDPAYPDGCYKVRIENDPGLVKDGLALNYEPGGLIEGYRIIPFGTAWASRVNIISRQKNGLKVSYKAEQGAVPQTLYGAISQAPVMIDTEDSFDLKRRARQAAAEAAALGRQIGIGLKLGSFRPLEAYNICDMVPVSIEHGAIHTSEWGQDNFGEEPQVNSDPISSGYWAVTGIAWETYDDGHWMTNLGLYPRNKIPKSLLTCTFIEPAVGDEIGTGPDIFGNYLTQQYSGIFGINWANWNGQVVSNLYPSTTQIIGEDDDGATHTTTVYSDAAGWPPATPAGLTYGTPNNGYGWGLNNHTYWWPGLVNNGVDVRWVWNMEDKGYPLVCKVAVGGVGDYPVSVQASDDGVIFHTVITHAALQASVRSLGNAICDVPEEDWEHPYWALRAGPHWFPLSGVSSDNMWGDTYFLMWEGIRSADTRA